MAKKIADETVAEEVVAEAVVADETVTEEVNYLCGELVANQIKFVSNGRFRCPKCGSGFNAELQDVIDGKVLDCGCDK